MRKFSDMSDVELETHNEELMREKENIRSTQLQLNEELTNRYQRRVRKVYQKGMLGRQKLVEIPYNTMAQDSISVEGIDSEEEVPGV
jgi:hypothetical protein